MFEAKMEDISLIRDSMATISELIDETEVYITYDGLKMIAADRAVVTVIDFTLSRAAFSEYTFEKEEKIGLNLNSLMQVLRRAKDGERLSLSIDQNKLNIVVEGESKRKFVLPIISIAREEAPPLDKLKFTAQFSVNSDILSNGVDDAELVADSIVFTVRKDMISLKSESDSSSAHMELLSGSQLKILEMNEPIRGRYSIDYMKKIMKAKKLSENVIISLSNDYPMKLDFSSGDKMKLSFILAPRVEEN